MDAFARLTSSFIKMLLDKKVLIVSTGATAAVGALVLGPEGVLLAGLGLGVEQLLARLGLPLMLARIGQLFPAFVNIIYNRWDEVKKFLLKLGNMLLRLFRPNPSIPSIRYDNEFGNRRCRPRDRDDD